MVIKSNKILGLKKEQFFRLMNPISFPKKVQAFSGSKPISKTWLLGTIL
jgi:predicted DNA-binding transcriptional regulator AlpA